MTEPLHPDVTEETEYGSVALFLAAMGDMVRSFREDCGLTREALSYQLGLGRHTVYRFEERGYGDFAIIMTLLEWMHRETLRDQARLSEGSRRAVALSNAESTEVGDLSGALLGGGAAR